MVLKLSPFKMLLYSTVTVLFISVVAALWVTVAQSEGCQDTTVLQHLLTCTFNKSTCGWIVHNPSAKSLWEIEGSNKFVMKMEHDSVNETVQLRSPTVCPTLNNRSSLTFKYNVESNFCELSVFLNGSGILPVWSTRNGTNKITLSNTVNIQSQVNVKIVLQWKKLDLGYCKLELSDIIFNCAVQGSETTSPSTDCESSGCTLPGAGSSSGGLSRGGIAGLIVSLVVIIAVLVIVFFLLRRREPGGKLPFQKLFGRLQTIMKTSSGSTNDAQAAARNNRPIIDGPHPEITSESRHLPKTNDYYSVPSDSLHKNNTEIKPGHGTHYVVSDVPESSNYYSMPRDSTGAHCGGKQTGDNPGYVAEDDGGYSTPDDIDRLEDTQKTNTTQNSRSGRKGTAGDGYNKISFQPPHAGSSRNAADTYHHINPLANRDTGTVNSIGVGMDKGVQDDKKYKVPRSEHAEYSLATNPGDPYDRPPTTPTGKTQNTDLTGKIDNPRANKTDFNHLKLKDGGSSPAGATSGKGKGQGVYSHLEGQVQIDNYNRVDFDGREGDKQTGDSGGPYNHLGD